MGLLACNGGLSQRLWSGRHVHRQQTHRFCCVNGASAVGKFAGSPCVTGFGGGVGCNSLTAADDDVYAIDIPFAPDSARASDLAPRRNRHDWSRLQTDSYGELIFHVCECPGHIPSSDAVTCGCVFIFSAVDGSTYPPGTM
jgi:hypothetical protein